MAGASARAVALLGLSRFKGLDFRVRALSESGDTEDTQRQRLATAIKIGILNYLAADGVQGALVVDVEQPAGSGRIGPAADRWDHWVMSLQGAVELASEESSRELELSGDIGADRVTDAWKITAGFEMEYRREDFDLEGDEPLRAIRNERDFDALVARSLDDHWSIGGRVSIDSTTFDNISLRVFGGPAVEYNVFPYSQYTRRQLRVGYAIGPYHARYTEETLFFTTSDTLTRHETSVTVDQREEWGSLQAQLAYSAFFPEPSRWRLQFDGKANVRLARGLSLSIEASASRIRDHLSLPRRGVTPEEVLLHLRRVGSRYEYGLQLGLTYTFGSIFSTIVNPRFGQ